MAMVSFSMFFSLLFSGGILVSLPLGMPPAEEDPVMSRVAPEECLLYVSWAGMATPDANSANRTEQLLADPEVRRFLSEIEKRLLAALHEGAGQGEKAQVVAAELPTLIRAIATNPAAFFVSRVGAGASGIEVPAGMIVNVGEDGAKVEQSLSKIEQILTGGQVQLVKDDNRTWHEFPTPPGSPQVRWTVTGKYLVAAAGEGVAEAMLERGRGSHVPAWLTRVRKRLPVGRVANVTYINGKGILRSATPFLDLAQPQVTRVLDSLGLKNFLSLASVTGLDDSACVTRTWFEFDGPPTGLLASLAAEPLKVADLSVIPADADLAFAARLDAAKLFDQFLSFLDQIEPRARAEIIEEMREGEDEIGFRVREDLLASLGDTWRVYHSPSEGGSLFIGWTAVASVRDAQVLTKVAKQLAAVVRKVNEEQIARRGRRARFIGIDDYEFEGQTIYFLNAVGEDDFPFAPAWCVTDDELVLSVFPQGVNAYLSRKKDSQGAKSSLADLPQVAAQFQDSAAPLILAYYNSREVFLSAYPLVQMFGTIICAELQREGVDVNVSILPSAGAIAKHLQPGTVSITSQDDGIEVVSRRTLPIGAEAMNFAFPLFVMGARSAHVHAHAARAVATVEVSPTAAQRRASMNNLKQIALAMHNFHATHRTFPAAATKDKNGKPLLSWRVHLLPFFEQQTLFKQFHLDEPWDSPHNKQLIARMPAVYRVPGSKPGDGKTAYLTMRDANTMFPVKLEKSRIADITDGTVNTIMVVEAAEDQAVVWTKPDDLNFDAKNPRRGLFGRRRGGFLAVMGDGSVRFFPDSLSDETIRRLFIRNDGKTINAAELNRPPRPRPPETKPVPPAAAPRSQPPLPRSM